eukprot:UN2900
MLKFVVLANMLALLSINPFDLRGGKVFPGGPGISALVNLRPGFKQKGIPAFGQLVAHPFFRILFDGFFRAFLPGLLGDIRLPVLQNIFKPFRCFSLQFLAKGINVSNGGGVSFFFPLIFDGKIFAGIDGSGGFLHVNAGSPGVAKKFPHVPKWVGSFGGFPPGLFGKLN